MRKINLIFVAKSSLKSARAQIFRALLAEVLGGFVAARSGIWSREIRRFIATKFDARYLLGKVKSNLTYRFGRLASDIKLKFPFEASKFNAKAQI